MPRTSWPLMSRYRLCLPSDHLLEAFEDIADPMLDRVVSNIHELRTLRQIRDLLLPKLMSAEIRLKEAEQTVEAAL